MSPCAICGTPSQRKYCSQRCKDLSRRHPCAVCAGPIWINSKTSLPVGQATCRVCRGRRAGGESKRVARCGFCEVEFDSRRRSDGTWTECCSRSCGQKRRAVAEGRYLGRDPEKLKANYRAKNYRRRTARRRRGDVTTAYERALRAKAKRCPLCSVKLTDTPFVPSSKELDHIIPINTGGTHTIGNVRIICRLCNQKRPNDGSDFIGQPTLWATDPEVILKPAQAKKIKPPKATRVRKPSPPKPQPRPCRTCGTQIVPAGRGRPRQWCEECRPAASVLRAAA